MRWWCKTIEKSYDSLSLEFLDNTMILMCFGDTLRGWMKACLYSSVYLILVRGSPSMEFVPK